jgi:hypothetical protein
MQRLVRYMMWRFHSSDFPSLRRLCNKYGSGSNDTGNNDNGISAASSAATAGASGSDAGAGSPLSPRCLDLAQFLPFTSGRIEVHYSQHNEDRLHALRLATTAMVETDGATKPQPQPAQAQPQAPEQKQAHEQAHAQAQLPPASASASSMLPALPHGSCRLVPHASDTHMLALELRNNGKLGGILDSVLF